MRVRMFTWLSGAPFYVAVHDEAVKLLPAGSGGNWLDVGCGPGLVSRLAAARGYRVVGVDAAPSMIAAARTEARREGSTASFEAASLDDVVQRQARNDVVSAASLLAVLPDKEAGLEKLWSLVAPGGHLLLVEPMPAMGLDHARRVHSTGALGRRGCGLLLWARAREGRSTAPFIDAWRPLDEHSRRSVRLLEGMVGAWVIRRKRPPEGDIAPDERTTRIR